MEISSQLTLKAFVCLRGHVEVGWEPYIPCKIPTPELYTRMHSMSPVAHIDKVRAPTLVLVGQVDRRVPPSQSVEYYKALKARGVTTRYSYKKYIS